MIESPRIIINADDFGLSSPVNDAVLDACERGILTSATIMANMPGFDEAVRGAKSLPKLGVGVHLNILRGSPLTDPARVPALVDRKGRFLDSPSGLWMLNIAGYLDIEQVELELAAQVSRAIDAGLNITHLDSEKHMHVMLPEVGAAACRVAARFGIRAIRVIRESTRQLPGVQRPPIAQLMKLRILNRQAEKLSAFASESGLKIADRFYGVAQTGGMIPDLYAKLFGELAPGSMEIMCHPAISDNASAGVRAPSWLDPLRVGEYRALLDPAVREALVASGAELINYGEL